MINKSKGANPQDMKNILVFAVVAMAFYWAWDKHVLEPRRQAAQDAKAGISQEMPLPQAEVVTIPRSDALAKSPRIQLSNGEVDGSIALKGAVIDDLLLSNYFKTTKKEEKVAILSPYGSALPRALSWGWSAGKQSSVVTPDAESMWTIESGTELSPNSPVTLKWENGNGLIFRKTFEIDDNFLITITQDVENKGNGDVILHPFSRLSQTGVPDGMKDSRIQHEGPLAVAGDELIEAGYRGIKKKDKQVRRFQTDNGWAGIADKYWLTALLPPDGEKGAVSLRYLNGKYQADTIGDGKIIPSGGSTSYTSHAFAGAKKVRLLDEYTKEIPVNKLNLAVNFGWFWFLSKPFFYMLHWINGLVGNMGFAIIILTLIIRTAVFPLTNISYKSFAHMKKVSPKILELRKKHGDDKSALQADIMKLYSKEKVNPMAGCLPILIQIPIFFSLYKVLYVTIEMRHAPFIGWLTDLSAPDPTSIFNLFGIIPWEVPSMLHIGVLPCLMLAALLVQKNLNPPPQDAMQRDLQNYFPFIMVFMLAHFPSGLVLYWSCSSIFSVAQQIFIMKSMGVEIHLFKKSKAEEALEESIGHIGEHSDESEDKK